MIIKIYPQNPNEREVARVVGILRDGGVVIFPTDGVYAYGCSMRSPKAVEKMKALKGETGNGFSVMFADLSHISDYVKVDNTAFRLLKRNLPGPFTFVMHASSKVPDKVLARRKTLGVRVAANPIPTAIVRELGEPMLTSSVKGKDYEDEYLTDPELIEEECGEKVDAVIDGGYGNLMPTTVVDMTGEEPEVIREGAGELKW